MLLVADGRDSLTAGKFAKDSIAHGGDPDDVKVVTCDMSPGFRADFAANFKNAVRVIDKFHVIKLTNDRVDQVRRRELKEEPLLKGTRCLRLRNDETLSPEQKEKFTKLSKTRLKTGRAYRIRCTLQDICEECRTREEAELQLKKLVGSRSSSVGVRAAALMR